MTRIAWGMLILMLAGLLLVVTTQPAAAQDSSTDQYSQQQPSSDQYGQQTPSTPAEQGTMAPETQQPMEQPEAVPPAQPQAAGEYPDVSSLRPFSPEANYMSVPGYLRWQVFRTQGRWLSYAEARRIVIAQGGQLYHAAV